MKLPSLMSMLLLFGCANVPQQQALKLKEQALINNWQSTYSYAEREVDLVSLVEDEHLKALVHKALINNFQLQRKALELKQARLLTWRDHVGKYPSLNATVNVNKNKNQHQQLAIGLEVSWELDTWGRLADQANSSYYNQQSIRADLLAARNSLAAQVLRTALLSIKLKKDIAIEQNRIKALQINNESVKQRFIAGNGKLNDWQASASALASAQANVIQLQDTTKKNSRALAVLVGELTGADIQLPNALPDIKQPYPNLPAEVVKVRPDIISALNAIKAADSLAASSYKRLLPSFSLTSSLTQAGNNPSQLLKADPVWSLLSNITQPLFNRSQIKSELESNKLAARRAYLNYQDILANAFAEIENLLSSRKAILSKQAYLRTAAKLARNNQREFSARYIGGIANINDLLMAQHAAFNAERDLLQSEYDQLSNRIGLALAMGLPASIEYEDLDIE